MFTAFVTTYVHLPLEALACCTLIVMQTGRLVPSITPLHGGFGLPLLAALTTLLNFFGRDPLILGIANLFQILTPLLTIGGYMYLRLRKIYEKKTSQPE